MGPLVREHHEWPDRPSSHPVRSRQVGGERPVEAVGRAGAGRDDDRGDPDRDTEPVPCHQADRGERGPETDDDLLRARSVDRDSCCCRGLAGTSRRHETKITSELGQGPFSEPGAGELEGDRPRHKFASEPSACRLAGSEIDRRRDGPHTGDRGGGEARQRAGGGLERLSVRSGDGELVGNREQHPDVERVEDPRGQRHRVEVILGMCPGCRGIRRPGERAVALGAGEAGHHVGIRCPDLVESDAGRARRVDDEVAPTGAEPRGKLGL